MSVLSYRKKTSELIATALREDYVPWRAEFGRPDTMPRIGDGLICPADSAVLLSFFKVMYDFKSSRWIDRTLAKQKGYRINPDATGFRIDIAAVRNKKTREYIDIIRWMEMNSEGTVNPSDYETSLRSLTLYNYDQIDTKETVHEASGFRMEYGDFINVLLEERGRYGYQDTDMTDPHARTVFLYEMLSDIEEEKSEGFKMLVADIAYAGLSKRIEMNDFGFGQKIADDFVGEWILMIENNPDVFFEACAFAENQLAICLEQAMEAEHVEEADIEL